MEDIINRLNDSSILFVSTKNKDYIRNLQEMRMLKKAAAKYEEIVYADRGYIKRLIRVYLACFRPAWKNADIIFVGFAPQLVFPFLKYWSKRKYVVIDFFISLYDTFVCDRRYFKEGSAAAKILHKIDEATLHSCHHVIADTRADRAFFSKEFHVPLKKIEVLYLEADKSIYDRNRFCMDRMTMLYFGSILPLQGIEVILEAARLLKDEKTISFIIIGPCSAVISIDDEEWPNVDFFQWLPQKKLAEKIADADLCLAGHFNAEIAKAKRTIPGKAYIYEAMGKSMILGDNSANRELFEEDGRHFYVEMGNAEALAGKIRQIRDKWRKK